MVTKRFGNSPVLALLGAACVLNVWLWGPARATEKVFIKKSTWMEVENGDGDDRSQRDIVYAGWVVEVVQEAEDKLLVRWRNRGWIPREATMPVAEANVAYAKSLMKDRETVNGYIILGGAYVREQRYADALQAYEKACSMNSRDAYALNALSWLLSHAPDAKVRDGARAVEVSLQACEMTKFDKSSFVENLANAYAELGDFERANEFARRAFLMDEQSKSARADMLLSFKRKEPVRFDPDE